MIDTLNCEYKIKSDRSRIQISQAICDTVASLCICLIAEERQTNCTELAYVFKLNIQMFVCPKPAANSGFERQDITSKAVIFRCSIRETPNC